MRLIYILGLAIRLPWCAPDVLSASLSVDAGRGYQLTWRTAGRHRVAEVEGTTRG